MNWYKRAQSGQLIQAIYQMLVNAYNDPVGLIDVQSELSSVPEFNDPFKITPSLSTAVAMVQKQQGTQPFNGLQQEIINEIKGIIQGPQNEVSIEREDGLENIDVAGISE